MQLVDRRTGKIVDMPDAQAAAAFKSGLFGLPRGSTMPFKTETGVVGTIDPKDAALGIDRRGVVPTEAEYRAAQQTGRYGGPGGALAAGGMGAVRGAGEAFGLGTDRALVGAAGALGDMETEIDPYRGKRTITPADRMREVLHSLEAEHPYASIGGELAGLVGASVATGGDTLMGEAGNIAESLAPKVLGRLGRGVARGAAEGGVLGGVAAVNESALGNTELNAEKLVAGIGHGAFMGGAIGGGFSGLGVIKDQVRDATGRYLSRLAPKDVEALAEKTFGYAPEGLGSRVQRAYTRASAAASGKDADVIGKLTELSPAGQEARRVAVFDAPKIQDAAERGIREHGDVMMREQKTVSDLARGEMKKEFLERAVKKGNEAEVREIAGNQIKRVLEGAEDELTHADGVAGPSVRAIETTSRAAYRAVAALEAGAPNATIYAELDTLKRSMQSMAKQGTRGIQAIADPIERINATRSLQWMKGAADDVRNLLEREDLFGKAAVAQRDVNAAWTKQIEASGRFRRALTTDVGRDPADPYARLEGIDPQKVSSYARNLVNPNQDLTHAAVKDYVASTRELVDAVKKHYELAPKELEAVERVHQGAVGFQGEIARAEKSLVLANQFRQLTEGSTDSLAALLGTVGGVVGGLPGGVVGAMAGSLANPGRTVAQLAAVERLMTKVDARIGASVRSFFRGGERAAKPPALHEAATPEGFDKSVKRVAETVDAEGAITPLGQKRITEAVGDLHEAAPKLATAASMKASTIATFLASKIPVAMQNPHEMFPGDAPPLVSESERETWARYVRASEDPTSVIEHLAHGTVTPEEAETLKVCYPRLYEEVQRQIGENVAKAAATGKPLDYAPRITMGVLFETRTDATMDPAVMGAVAAAQTKRRKGAQREQQAHFIRPVPQMASRFQTTFEASASRRKGGMF